MWCSAVGGFVTLILSLLVASLAAGAQPATKVYRIGWLSAGSLRPDLPSPVDALRQGLPDLAAELVQLQVDVIVAPGTAAVRAAQYATRTIPIVMAGTADPLGQGLVPSLARPEGNITGLSLLMAELPGKRLGLLKETVP